MQNRWLPFSRSRAVALVGVLAALLFATAARASPRQVAAQVHKRGGYPDSIHIQPGSPGFGAGQGQGGSDWGPENDPSSPLRVHRSSHPVRRSSKKSSGWSGSSGSSGSNALGVLLLGLLLAGLLVLVVWLAARIRRPPVAEKEPRAPLPDNRAPEAAAPGEPDALAAEGRFEEAMRAVLLRALERVGWSADSGAATTAREVVRGLDRADARREPLAAIVRNAEAVRFAGAAATRERYVEMRDLLQRLMPGGSAS